MIECLVPRKKGDSAQHDGVCLTVSPAGSKAHSRRVCVVRKNTSVLPTCIFSGRRPLIKPKENEKYGNETCMLPSWRDFSKRLEALRHEFKIAKQLRQIVYGIGSNASEHDPTRPVQIFWRATHYMSRGYEYFVAPTPQLVRYCVLRQEMVSLLERLPRDADELLLCRQSK